MNNGGNIALGVSYSGWHYRYKHEVDQEVGEEAIRLYLRHWSPRYCRALGVEWPGFDEASYREHAAAFLMRCRAVYGDRAPSIGALLVDYVQMAGARSPAAE